MSKVAIINVAGRGFGAKTARGCRGGYNVCISYLLESESAAHVVRDCEAAGRKAIAVRGDVENVANVSNLFVAMRSTSWSYHAAAIQRRHRRKSHDRA